MAELEPNLTGKSGTETETTEVAEKEECNHLLAEKNLQSDLSGVDEERDFGLNNGDIGEMDVEQFDPSEVEIAADQEEEDESDNENEKDEADYQDFQDILNADILFNTISKIAESVDEEDDEEERDEEEDNGNLNNLMEDFVTEEQNQDQPNEEKATEMEAVEGSAAEIMDTSSDDNSDSDNDLECNESRGREQVFLYLKEHLGERAVLDLLGVESPQTSDSEMSSESSESSSSSDDEVDDAFQARVWLPNSSVQVMLAGCGLQNSNLEIASCVGRSATEALKNLVTIASHLAGYDKEPGLRVSHLLNADKLLYSSDRVPTAGGNGSIFGDPTYKICAGIVVTETNPTFSTAENLDDASMIVGSSLCHSLVLHRRNLQKYQEDNSETSDEERQNFEIENSLEEISGIDDKIPNSPPDDEDGKLEDIGYDLVQDNDDLNVTNGDSNDHENTQDSLMDSENSSSSSSDESDEETPSFSVEWLEYLVAFNESFLALRDNGHSRTESEFYGFVDDIAEHGLLPVLSIVCDFYGDVLKGFGNTEMMPISSAQLCGILYVFDAVLRNRNSKYLNSYQLKKMCWVLFDMITVSPPSDLHAQTVLLLGMALHQFNDDDLIDIVSEICAFIDDTLNLVLTSCFHNWDIKCKFFNLAVLLATELEKLNFMFATKFQWHLNILDILKGSTSLRRIGLDPQRKHMSGNTARISRIAVNDANSRKRKVDLTDDNSDLPVKRLCEDEAEPVKETISHLDSHQRESKTGSVKREMNEPVDSSDKILNSSEMGQNGNGQREGELPPPEEEEKDEPSLSADIKESSQHPLNQVNHSQSKIEIESKSPCMDKLAISGSKSRSVSFTRCDISWYDIENSILIFFRTFFQKYNATKKDELSSIHSQLVQHFGERLSQFLVLPEVLSSNRKTKRTLGVLSRTFPAKKS